MKHPVCPFEGKQTFRTEHQARRVLREWERRPGQHRDRRQTDRSRTGTFRCRACGGWHLGRSAPVSR